jgi:hypothetical protein
MVAAVLSSIAGYKRHNPPKPNSKSTKGNREVPELQWHCPGGAPKVSLCLTAIEAGAGKEKTRAGTVEHNCLSRN